MDVLSTKSSPQSNGVTLYNSASVDASICCPVALNENKSSDSYVRANRFFLNLRFDENDSVASKFLYDTGAAISLINQTDFNLAKSRGAVLRRVIPKNRPDVRNASGGKMKSLGIYEIAYHYNGAVYHGKFFLCPDLGSTSIVGMNIICKDKLTLSLGNDLIVSEVKCPVPEVCALSSEREWSIVATKKCVIQPRESRLVKCCLVDQHNNRLKESREFMCILPLINVAIRSDDDGVFAIHFPNNEFANERTIERADILGAAEPMANFTKLTDFVAATECIVEQSQVPKNKVHTKEDLATVKDALWKNIVKNVHVKYRQKYFNKLFALAHAFSASPMDLGQTDLVEHEIHLEDKRPIYTQQFRLPQDQLQYIKEHVASWLKAGLIERTKSPYNSPIFCVPKKTVDAEGKHLIRVVLDYRLLNSKTLPDKYSIRTIDQCIDEVGLAGSTIFSCIDLTNGFWQMLLREQDRPPTAFTIAGCGQFQWCVTAMGLTGAPASFSRLIDAILRDTENVITFIDDVLVHSRNHSEHLAHLSNAIVKLSSAGLKLNPNKCIFGSDEVQYLGHTLSSSGVSPGLDKSAAITSCEPPINGKQLKSFLGLANYFRGYIKNFAKRAAPLFKLTRQASSWKSGPLPNDAITAFEDIKSAIAEKPLLKFVNRHGHFHLFVDACLGDEINEGGLGAVLMQDQPNGHKLPVGYASRRLTTHEKNYPIFVAEMTAAVFGMEAFDPYLRGRRFTLYSDHKPLCKLSTSHTKTLNRLQLKMSEMYPDIKYVDAKSNTVADFLSRYQGLNVAQVYDSSFIVNVAQVDSSPFRLQTLQADDPNLQPIIQMLRSSKDPSKPMKPTGLRHHYFLQKGVLMISPPKRRGFIQGRPNVVVPITMQNEIITEAHNSSIGGHAGTFKTTERIREEFWWPSIDTDINDHIKACKACQAASNRYRTRSAPLQPLPQTTRPNERVHIDLFGGLKTSEKKNNFVLVITDSFSKMVKLVAIRDKNPTTVAQALLDNYIFVHGVPKLIFSDQGLEWCNEFSRALWDLLNIEHKTTTPYMPSTNAQCEVFNKTLAHFLKTAILQDNVSTLDWEMYLAPLMFSYNTAVNKSTKVTPFYATYGYPPRVPLWDDSLEKHQEKPMKNASYADHLAKHHQTISVTRKIVTQNSTQAREQYTEAHDKAKDPVIPRFKPGDKVWVKINQKSVPNPKLAASWEPGIIVERKSLSTYLVSREHRARKKRSTLNADKLRPRYDVDDDVDDEDEEEDNEDQDVRADDEDQDDKAESEIDLVAALNHYSQAGSLSYDELLELLAAGWSLMGSFSKANANQAPAPVPAPVINIAPQQDQQPVPGPSTSTDLSPTSWLESQRLAAKKHLKTLARATNAKKRLKDHLKSGPSDHAPSAASSNPFRSLRSALDR